MPQAAAIAEALAPTQTEWGSSRAAELQRCSMAHHLKYDRGILPRKEAAYFDVGRYTHAGLQYVNTGVIAGERRDWRDVLQAADSARTMAIEAGTMARLEWDEIDPIAEAWRLLDAYYALHGSDNGGWPEQAVLRHVELPLGGGDATARADLIVSLGDELVICDTKTRSKRLPEDRERYTRDLRTNEQFLRLSALAQRHFGTAEPPPVWLDAIIKTKIPAVDRLLVRFTQADIDMWWENHAALREVTAALRHLPVVRNYHECAPPMGSRCWAFEYCHGNDETRAAKYRVREVATT